MMRSISRACWEDRKVLWTDWYRVAREPLWEKVGGGEDWRAVEMRVKTWAWEALVESLKPDFWSLSEIAL
jgi:hypothetical protein